MHDIRTIRENPDQFDAALGRLGMPAVAQAVLEIDTARRASITDADNARSDQNTASKLVGAAKAKGDEAEFERLRALVSEKKADVARLEDDARVKDAELRDMLLSLPNIPDASVPDGTDEADNVEIRRWGTPRTFDFVPAEHYELKAVSQGMDFATAAKLSGARFVVLRGAVARIHRALAQFMLDLHTDEHALTEHITPVLVRDEAMLGTGQLPKFAEDSYQTTTGWWLIPTAEVTLTNTVAGLMLDAQALPIRMVAHTQCFRSEAGSAGRDTSGMLRQHQFEKVEMVSITAPTDSHAEHERMTRCAEIVLERLDLPYRTVALCSGDIGFGAVKTHDIEVWLPGQNTYREISSVSTCGAFQARRMNARMRDVDGKPDFVHTLNGSGLAVGRCLIAVLENGQQADGSVELPAALVPYLGGKSRISAEGLLTA